MAIVIRLLVLALVLSACGLPPESVKRIADCSAMYTDCVDRSLSMADYRHCREGVDAKCLEDTP